MVRRRGVDAWFYPKSRDTTQLVLLFGATQLLKEEFFLDEIKRSYPKAYLFGCSTAGEICGTQVTDNTLAVTAVQFKNTQVKGAQVKLSKSVDSLRAGEILAKSLDNDGLVHVIVLSDGIM